MPRKKSTPIQATVHTERNFYISDSEDKPMAHVNVYERMMGLWISNFWVKETMRGKGLGTLLFQRMVDDLGPNHDLYLNVHPYAGDTLTHDQLIAFYEKFGFRMTTIKGIMFRRRGS